ncbi:MAG: metallophosphoesterase [Deltaproteobacteria bacterium]|nr:MAG: metallophosphoesterase [Deltaproteobacteria bacterium]
MMLSPAEAMRLGRRRFLQAGASLGALSLAGGVAACGDDADAHLASSSAGSPTEPGGTSSAPSSERASAGEVTSASRYWYIAIIADSHMIDEYYEGPESNELDTQSILQANERFVLVRDFLNSLEPRLEAVFHLGDLIHTYPSTEEAFFVQNRTSLDIAREAIDGFEVPFRFLMGNHDYFVPRAPREFTHELFAEKFENWQPYHSVDLHGWKFISLNNYLGHTWDASDGSYEKDVGSFGEEQLQWLEAQLQEGKPSFVFLHHPHNMNDHGEFGEDFSFRGLMRTYRDTVAMTMSGHWHRWFDLRIPRGPENWLIGSTRYDEDAFVIVEFDRESPSWRFVNQASWNLYSHITDRWEPVVDDEGRFQG